MQTMLLPPKSRHMRLKVEADAQDQVKHVRVAKLPFFIGRDESNDLTLTGTPVSRRHAVIELRDDQFVIRDLGSTNGTLVNECRTTECSISDGDRISLGNYELTVCLQEPASNNVTQVLTDDDPKEDAEELIRKTRRISEAAARGYNTNRLHAVHDLRACATLASSCWDPTAGKTIRPTTAVGSTIASGS